MNGAYLQTIPDTITLGYYPWGDVASNILIADKEMYGKTRNCPTESASCQTRYIDHTMLKLKRRFELLAREWKRETVNLSSIQKISMNNAYLQIIGLGPVAIKLILNELEREPDFWFCALRALTRTNPVPPEMSGDLNAMTKVWLDWGQQHGYR